MSFDDMSVGGMIGSETVGDLLSAGGFCSVATTSFCGVSFSAGTGASAGWGTLLNSSALPFLIVEPKIDKLRSLEFSDATFLFKPGVSGKNSDCRGSTFQM